MCSWEWFPESKGLVSGLTIGGFGLAAFLFGFVTTAIVNPENLGVETPKYGPKMPEGTLNDTLFPESVAVRVPKMFYICIAIWFVLGMSCFIFIQRNPEYVKAEEEREEAIKQLEAKMGKEKVKEEEESANFANFVEFKDALKTARFW